MKNRVARRKGGGEQRGRGGEGGRGRGGEERGRGKGRGKGGRGGRGKEKRGGEERGRGKGEGEGKMGRGRGKGEGRKGGREERGREERKGKVRETSILESRKKSDLRHSRESYCLEADAQNVVIQIEIADVQLRTPASLIIINHCLYLLDTESICRYLGILGSKRKVLREGRMDGDVFIINVNTEIIKAQNFRIGKHFRGPPYGRGLQDLRRVQFSS